ncbi:MAG: NADH-quinone oxidoreductase subunit NuoK [Candidatus Omnitrophica bacterium]|nr:NADH-quinone oxidoreductase subunit NuoK [Candidatus Omnitrophota bacterium]
MIPLAHAFLLSGALFVIGLAGVMIRRNVLMILLSIELMMNAANLTLIAAAAKHADLHGQMVAFFVMVIAAAEVAVGLAIAVLLFRNEGSVDTDLVKNLKG